MAVGFMRIRQDRAFLLIERRDPRDRNSPCRAEAASAAPGCEFSAVCEEISFDASAEALAQFADFQTLKSQRLEIKLSEGGWLRLRRDGSGALVVHYRLGRWDLGAAAEGEIAVPSDAAAGLCRELGSLIRGTT